MHVPIVLNVYNVYIERNREKIVSLFLWWFWSDFKDFVIETNKKNVFEMCY